jgi:invasion protein IalB
VKRVLLIATILLAAASTAAVAIAKQAVPPAAPAQQAAGNKPEVSYFGDWAVRCFPIKSASPCDMLFATVRKDTNQRVTSVSIAYVPSKDSYVMQVAVPLGIDLSKGVIIAAGDYSTAKLVVRRCDNGGCYVETGITGDLLQGLEQNSSLGGQLKIVADGGKPLSLAMSLKGFAAAHEALVTSARQKATQ